MMQGMDASKAAILEAGLARIRERFIASLDDRIEGFCALLEKMETLPPKKRPFWT